MNKIGHVEFPSTDFKSTKKFFGKLFGWKFQIVKNWDYMLYYAPKPPHGGFYLIKKMPKAQTVIPYIEVKNIEKKLEEIIKLKGKIIVKKSPIGKWGWWAKFATPDGCHVALWENVKK